MALLKGFGAAAINPYLAFESHRRHDLLGDADRRDAPSGPEELHQGGVQGDHQGDVQDGHLDGGLLHRGPGVRSGRPGRRRGRGVLHRHRVPHRWRRAWTCWPRRWPPATGSPTCDRPTELAHREREVGGEYQWRREGEIHLFNPKTVFKLQHATRSKRYEVFKEYTKAVDDQAAQLATLRGLMHLRTGVLPAVPIDEVESAEAHPGPLLDRRHVLRVDLGRGPRDPGHRHEPPRGRSNTGEGGRGPRPLHARRQRGPPAQRHQTGGLGPVRGDLGVPGQRRRHPDQDRPGGQAR